MLEAHPDLPAWLVVAGGAEPETHEVIQLGRELLHGRVRFLVEFPRQRMPDLYRAADGFVLCSLREMFGIVLCEATASGIPCLVHDDPVLRWVVGPGGDPVNMSRPGLLQVLYSYLRDMPRRQKVGALARHYCLEHFSRNKVIDQILQYYRFVLSDGPSRLDGHRPNRGRPLRANTSVTTKRSLYPTSCVAPNDLLHSVPT